MMFLLIWDGFWKISCCLACIIGPRTELFGICVSFPSPKQNTWYNFIISREEIYLGSVFWSSGPWSTAWWLWASRKAAYLEIHCKKNQSWPEILSWGSTSQKLDPSSKWFNLLLKFERSLMVGKSNNHALVLKQKRPVLELVQKWFRWS